MDLHSANANKLEQLIAQTHSELLATQQLNEKVTDERISVLREREKQLQDQQSLIAMVKDEMVLMKEQLEKERIRLASLYAQFDLSIASFKRETEEERRRLLESQYHYETLRQQIEKDRLAPRGVPQQDPYGQKAALPELEAALDAAEVGTRFVHLFDFEAYQSSTLAACYPKKPTRVDPEMTYGRSPSDDLPTVSHFGE